MQPGTSSYTAEEGKVAKYSAENDGLKYQIVVIEPSGVFGPSSMKFLEYVGSKIIHKASDKPETERLFQRILLAVMRVNAYSVMVASRMLK